MPWLCGVAWRGIAQLELIEEVDRTNVLIAYPVMLEEWLMEGSYNKVRA